MPFTHSFIDREIQRIKDLEDVSKEEKAYRIETWQKLKADAVSDDELQQIKNRKSNTPKR